VVALIVGVAATAAALTGSREGRAGRVADLVRLPARARLALTVRDNEIELVNRSSRSLRWAATADVPWLRIGPARGVLKPGGTALLQIRLQPSSPEGALRTTIRVTGADGSAAAAVYATTVERPPDLATRAEGCHVTATVEDASGVGAVALRWTDTAGAHDVAMGRAESGYAADLPAGVALTWSVIATDTLGNQARTPENRLTCQLAER
ncbi:MAG: hypothetical protein H0W70_14190, partial [Actinobacteria bacterium]|nr:hypothetical protein [Actinomycetota bacterium]